MEIFKYEIVNKKTDRTRPFFDKESGLFVCRIPKIYHWYCIARVFNIQDNEYDYFILFSDVKFAENCRKCHIDDFGRYRLRPGKDFAKWLLEYYDVDNGNFDVKYMETIDNYDVYSVE